MTEPEIPASFSQEADARLAGRAVPEELIPDMERVVRGIAGQLHARLPQGCGIELRDLIQAGNVGLLQAARNFRQDSGAPLGGYARFRIRGEMLDMVRRSASAPQASSLRVREDSEAATVDSALLVSAGNLPDADLSTRQRAEILDEELDRLPARHRTVVRLRYGRQMTLREIGNRLQVNESRACQLHQSALTRLRKALGSRGVSQMAHL